MTFHLHSFVQCVYLIAFSYIFLEEGKWSAWRYISVLFIAISFLTLRVRNESIQPI